MPTQIEAKRLSGIDRGKHVSITAPRPRYGDTWTLAGELVGTRHWGDGTVDIIVKREDHDGRSPSIMQHLPPDTIVTVTDRTP